MQVISIKYGFCEHLLDNQDKKLFWDLPQYNIMNFGTIGFTFLKN